MPLPARNADQFSTWAPHFLFDVIQGTVPADELRRRTVSLTLVDNDREYDTIEWTLINNDGLLTRVENMALGLIVRVRLGYNNYTMNWRTFVISRMRGGVGVYGRENPAVHEGGSTITLSGRNRNAPDVKGRRTKNENRIPKPGKSGRSTYRRSRGVASSSISQHDTAKKDGWVSPTEEERVIRAIRISDAIREVGRRMGYTDRQMDIQDTDDVMAEVVIPQGMTYAEFVEKEALRLGWIGVCKQRLKFHPQRWRREKQRIKLELTYGGPDITNLTIDADFRLPTPRTYKAKARNPIIRESPVVVANDDNAPMYGPLASYLIQDDRQRRVAGAETRDANLRRSEVEYVTGGMQKVLTHKAERAFVNKNIRAMQISLTIVGNPALNSRDAIVLKGTGCQLVDGEWYVSTAKHVYDGSTYVTQLDLRPPPKQKKKGGKNTFSEAPIVKEKGKGSTNPVGSVGIYGRLEQFLIAAGKLGSSLGSRR